MPFKFETFEDKKQAFANATQNGTEEEQAAALGEMMNALSVDVRNDIFKQVQGEMSDTSVLQSRGMNVLTSEEKQFFNVVIEEGGFKDTETLPTTTQERIFQDIVETHPLLQELGIRNLGAITEFIDSDPEGAAVWGPIFGDIKGQLNASFSKESIEQLKLTAFVPLHNDMLQLGPNWVERYVRTMLREAISVGMERGFVEGDGQDMPIGLLYKKESNGAVVAKESAGTLTFAAGETIINEYADILELLSTTGEGENEEYRNVDNRVVMVVNPLDHIRLRAKTTVQTVNGSYVRTAPYNFPEVPSKFVPRGKAIFFVRGEYLAATGGAYQMSKFDQTLAMEDATLYISKQFATGRPKDQYAAQVYDLQLTEPEPDPA